MGRHSYLTSVVAAVAPFSIIVGKSLTNGLCVDGEAKWSEGKIKALIYIH